MKMESGVAASVDGIIADVMVSPGQTVEAGDLLVRFAEPREKDKGTES